MSARLTLDRGAMEVLLDQMSEEMKADFSGNVMRQVVHRLTNQLTVEQFKRELEGTRKKELSKYLEDVKSWKPELSRSQLGKLTEAYEAGASDLFKKFESSLYDIKVKARQEAEEHIERHLKSFAERMLKVQINEMVQDALKANLDSLIELGEAMREMKTVTPEIPDEPE